MARKRRKRPKENGDRWLVSYADFITLLFAFFTSMYAISSVNEGKYKTLSSALSTAFNRAVETTPPAGLDGPQKVGLQGKMSERFNEAFSSRYQTLATSLKGLPANLGVRLVMEKGTMIIRLPGKTLFSSGSASLTPEARAILSRLAPIIRELGSEVRIEGHTDNVPTSNMVFNSNWDLSSARALSVLKYLVNKNNLDPRLVSSTGYGEFRPLAPNNTPTGRQKNRRVDIVLER